LFMKAGSCGFQIGTGADLIKFKFEFEVFFQFD
jgi:hypothetical protein